MTVVSFSYNTAIYFDFPSHFKQRIDLPVPVNTINYLYIHHSILAKQFQSIHPSSSGSLASRTLFLSLEDVLEINQACQITICTSFSLPLLTVHPRISREDYRRTSWCLEQLMEKERRTNGVILWRQSIHVLPVTWRQSHS